MALSGKAKAKIAAALIAAFAAIFTGLTLVGGDNVHGDNNKCSPGVAVCGRGNKVNIDRDPKASPELKGRYIGSSAPVADNADPKQSGCDSDATTIDKVQVITREHELLGYAELRKSDHCHTAWGRFFPSDRLSYLRDANAKLSITAQRPDTHTTGSTYTVTFDGQPAFGNMLVYEKGCIQAKIVVHASSGDGQATTACLPSGS